MPRRRGPSGRPRRRAHPCASVSWARGTARGRGRRGRCAPSSSPRCSRSSRCSASRPEPSPSSRSTGSSPVRSTTSSHHRSSGSSSGRRGFDFGGGPGRRRPQGSRATRAHRLPAHRRRRAAVPVGGRHGQRRAATPAVQLSTSQLASSSGAGLGTDPKTVDARRPGPLPRRVDGRIAGEPADPDRQTARHRGLPDGPSNEHTVQQMVLLATSTVGCRHHPRGRARHLARAPQPRAAAPGRRTRRPRSRRRRSTRDRSRSPSGSPRRTPTPAPRSARSARPSTRCSTTSRGASTPGTRASSGCASSSPTPRTSCARRWPRSGGMPSCPVASAEPVPADGHPRDGPHRVRGQPDELARRGPAPARPSRRRPSARARRPSTCRCSSSTP